MSGEQELETALPATEARLKEFEKELNELIESIGVSFILDEVSIQAMNLTYEDLKKLHPQEALIFNYKLHQYGLYLQSLFNRAENIKHWASHNLNTVVGKEGHNYGNQYTKFEERKILVSAGNSYAQALNKIYLKAASKANELNMLSNKVEKIAFALYELSKRKEQNG